ncbi:hypothetical protein DFH05DRAFT_1130602 [Lentinula detonsa]|uniref:Secreted protein n=1 Tax=Lentinula detonsa TaxID=2804962 RepID=A0A9W8NZH3_9AGAR|nr:hypothetical protein DFH05DRAFT_1130602 [Lentinula detonsa]
MLRIGLLHCFVIRFSNVGHGQLTTCYPPVVLEIRLRDRNTANHTITSLTDLRLEAGFLNAGSAVRNGIGISHLDYSRMSGDALLPPRFIILHH